MMRALFFPAWLALLMALGPLGISPLRAQPASVFQSRLTTFPPDPVGTVPTDDGPLPVEVDRYVNDFAGVMAAEDRAEMSDLLARLETDTGVRLTLVTFRDLREFGWHPSEKRDSFLKALHAHWNQPEVPNFLLWGLGIVPRHNQLFSADSYRYSWARESEAILREYVPNPLDHPDLGNELLVGAQGCEKTIRESFEAWGWLELALALGFGGLLYFAYSASLDYKDPEAGPQELKRPTLIAGKGGKPLTANDLFQDIGYKSQPPGKKDS